MVRFAQANQKKTYLYLLHERLNLIPGGGPDLTLTILQQINKPVHQILTNLGVTPLQKLSLKKREFLRQNMPHPPTFVRYQI